MKRNEEGAVTVYFVAATAAFVLLAGLLIDYARIAAFRKQAELSVKSGVRSALAAYDPLLFDRYGMFVRGGEPADDLFRRTLEGNAAEEGKGALPYLDLKWGEAGVTESRPLSDHRVFRRQVLEEMKYKAPIDLSIEIAGRFKGIAGAMKETAKTVDVLERMRKAYDRREKAFDDALEVLRKQGDEVAERAEGLEGRVAGIATGYDDYVSKRKEDEARREALRLQEQEEQQKEESGESEEDEEDEKEGPRNEAAVAAFESEARELASSLIGESSGLRDGAESSREEAYASLAKARQANEEMKAIVAQADSLPAEEKSDDTSVDDGTLKQIRQSAKDLVLDSGFFETFESEADGQRASGAALAAEMSSLSSLLAAVPGSTGLTTALGSGKERLQSAIAAYGRTYGPKGAVWNERTAELEAHRSNDKERKEQEKQAEAQWAGAANFIGTLAGVSGNEEEKAQFAEADGLYRANLKWNEAEEDKASKKITRDPSEGRDEALRSSDGMFEALGGSLAGARDQLYFSEYAMARFSSYDPSLVKELLEGGNPSLDLHLQEAEYILYGLPNPSGNIAAAYGEVFGLRLAIRTMEGLIECRSFGHPLLVLAAALVYGIANATLDMGRLVASGKIQLSKYAKMDTYYADYLRLFLLAHGGSSGAASRMISVMEHASGVDFSGAYTYTRGEATASFRLWFYPGILKKLGRQGEAGGTIKGNRYEATYVADSSYL
ncbi:hypothetical protein ACFPPD_16675 [Cohnella suwonensis]|uniref:Flp pilus-assembly TadG-like N-terminal domain-containing protein n=1 Tax=Cohnella suwonensis TaxID=696072 RepID=A0ABW0LX72_9BACL